MEGQNIKHREIVFDAINPNHGQALGAAMRLADVVGIHEVRVITSEALHISYHLLEITLEQIEDGLRGAGFHLSNKLLYKLRRSLHYYTEETERANKGCPKGSSNCTRTVFIAHYQHKEHGCRDHRPDHWRRYL